MEDDEAPGPRDPTPVTPQLLIALVGVGSSTGFLERFLPRCMWRSQYFCPATTSLEQRHFLPSVLRHRPGSGSIAPLPQYPDCNTDPTNKTMFTFYSTNRMQQHNITSKNPIPQYNISIYHIHFTMLEVFFILSVPYFIKSLKIFNM